LTEPVFGYLIKNGTDTLKSGDIIAQGDINAGLVAFFAHAVKEDTADSFHFLAFDEKNNWTGRQVFRIRILNDFSIPFKEEAGSLNIKWYPNPARQYLHVENPWPFPITVHCYSIDGRRVFTLNLGSGDHQKFRLPSSMEGVYILQFRLKNEIRTHKVMVLRD
jgi:hypothetical protein